jgi:uncharacterized membrane protein/thiol-disulfide isomerase/thioredoxin
MRRLIILSTLILSLLSIPTVSKAQEASPPVVHAVLFYSPSCGHCEYVITQALPPLFKQYGEQLTIIGIDVSQPTGHTLFVNTIQYFNLETAGVPLLVIDDTYLVGSIDIPEKLPGLIEQYLAQGGLDWPAIPGLAEVLAASQTTPTPTVEATSQVQPTTSPATPSPVTASPTPSTGGIIISNNHNLDLWERLTRDPAGNGLALIVLAGMLFTLLSGINIFQRFDNPKPTYSFSWLIPVLCMIGLVVAGYLAFVETKQVEAFCGPVGDCNTVQQSEYARLFGVLPIGILGIIGYVMIALAWMIERSANQRRAAYASLALLAMSAFGVLFSIYLTFLEPFVIGATCAWCLASAIIMTALLWLSIRPGKAAIKYIFYGEKHAEKRRRYRSTF